MNKLLAFILAFAIAQAWAADPLNTYRYNRKNHFEKNGQVERTPWFEWWYYKVIIPQTNEAFYFTYGVVNPWDFNHSLKGTRSAVEMGDFQSRQTYAQELSPKDFEASYNVTQVQVGQNWASDKELHGILTNSLGKVAQWNIKISKNWHYDATSWATGRGLTNIEWYPAQASATCEGEIISDHKTYRFKNAPCYQDRNWGIEFPEWWTWIVSNNFNGHPQSALAVGGGKPKFKNGFDKIEGVSIGLKHKGREYSWRPNDLDFVKIDINFGKWEVKAADSRFKVEIKAHAPKSKFMDLQFATPTGEIFHDYEALQGDVVVRLYKRTLRGWKLLDEIESNSAGIEFGSHDTYDLDQLFNKRNALIE